ncbi:MULTISPECIES: rhodanese-like domain-containing protein [Pseudomonas]|uniref:rhodanese-like domain-containing protein n=1 Tax=Pseudomonas TaxID=286 RepID=UPI0022AF5DCE|nr:rhodanese-like domain-containing protein [Pseudomonas anguilliseptica]MCZ4322850.1 rhodanese-like domain-containing protein [Pseudomonas anguilliseptica]
MMKRSLVVVASLFVAHSIAAQAEQNRHPLAKVSYDDFKTLVAEVEPHRQKRLVDLDTFLEMSQQPGVVILDTRSAFRFERIHLKGAKHLSFPDFTQDNLREVIPSQETVVLIYCNNNFDGNEVDFASKIALPVRPLHHAGKAPPTTPTTQFKAQEKPLMLALNVPTYITLYGYGYRNVYELDELVDVTDPRVSFEGTVAANK